MSVTRADLIAAYPEFGATALYPEVQVTFWLTEAQKVLSADRLGARYTLAVVLFAAHNLALGAQAARAAQGGGTAGTGGGGLVTSKSIDKVSVSYDVTTTAIQGAGPWNATTYGQRYFQLVRGLATGPFYRSPSPRGLYVGLVRQ